MLHQTIKIVVAVVVLTACNRTMAQDSGYATGGGYYGGQVVQESGQNGGRLRHHGNRFRENCGRGITQQQAADLWSGYCNDNCGFNGGSSCGCEPECKSGCRLGSRLGSHFQGCRESKCDSDCNECDNKCGCKLLGRFQSECGGCGLFSKNRRPCGCSGSYFGKAAGYDYGSSSTQSAVTGCGNTDNQDDSAPKPTADNVDFQPSVSDTQQ